MSSQNDQSDSSKDVIGLFINPQGSLKTTKKKLKRNKPNQQPQDIVFEGFHQIVKGIKQDHKKNEIYEQELHPNKKSTKLQPVNPKSSSDFNLKQSYNKKGIEILDVLKKIRNDVKQQKKNPNKMKNRSPQQSKSSNQKQKQKKKSSQKGKQKRKEKQKVQKMKHKRNSRKKEAKEQNLQINRDRDSEMKIKQGNKEQSLNKRDIKYVSYDSVELEQNQNQGYSENGNVFNRFKNFSQHQKVQVKQQQTLKKLQKQDTKDDKSKSKPQCNEIKSNRKKINNNDLKSQKPKRSAKQKQKQQKPELVKQKKQKSQPNKSQVSSGNAKPIIKPPFLNKLGKGKKQRIDPRKQSLKQIIDTYNNKLKSKELNTRIFTNLFGNQVDFAIAYETKRIDSSYFLKCIVTPLDHRAVAIILTHKFPKQFFIDQTLPFPQQNGVQQELFVFYENLYALPEIEYYQKYLQIVLVYKRKSARSLRVTLDEVMKQKLKVVETAEQKKQRKNIEQLLSRIQKSEKEQQWMMDIRRENEMKLQRNYQQRKLKGTKRGAEITQYSRSSQDHSDNQIIFGRKERKKAKQTKLEPKQQNDEPKRRVIVIDEREELRDSSSFDSQQSVQDSSSESGSQSSFSHQYKSQEKQESVSNHSEVDSEGNRQTRRQSYKSDSQEKSEESKNQSGKQESENQSELSQSLESIECSSIDEDMDSEKHKRQSDGSLSMGSGLEDDKSEKSQNISGSSNSGSKPHKNNRFDGNEFSQQESHIESSDSVKISMEDS